jgi:hypothetical protein
MSAQISQGLCFGKEKIDQVVAIQPQGPTTWGSQPSTWGGEETAHPMGGLTGLSIKQHRI